MSSSSSVGLGSAGGYTTPDSALKYQARLAEQESAQRIQAATDRTKAVEQEEEVTTQRIHDEYEKQRNRDASNQDSALASQKMKSYEQLRDLQRNQSLDQQRIRRDGETQTAKLEEYIRNTIDSDESKGKEALKSQQYRNMRNFEYERDQGLQAFEELKARNTHSIEQIQETTEKQTQKMTEASQSKLELMQQQQAEANEKIEKTYQDKFSTLSKGMTEQLTQVETEGSEKLQQIRQDTAGKLSSYRSRQEDPFYKLVSLDAALEETSDGFILRATVPEYEQQHLSVGVHGDALFLSGYRRNEEELQLGEGRKQTTASFQSFNESFPLSWPVDAKQLTRTNEGDQVIIRVPKKNEFAFRKPEIRRPEKHRAVGPQFPLNLPRSNASPAPSEPKPLGRKPGSGTLT